MMMIWGLCALAVIGQALAQCPPAIPTDSSSLENLVKHGRPLYDLIVYGQNDDKTVKPGKQYSVGLRSLSSDLNIKQFQLHAEPEHKECGFGLFRSKVHDKYQKTEGCPHIVTQLTKPVKTSKVSFRWKTPKCGCVKLRATVFSDDGKSHYAGDDFLSKHICTEGGIKPIEKPDMKMQKIEVPPVPEIPFLVKGEPMVVPKAAQEKIEAEREEIEKLQKHIPENEDLHKTDYYGAPYEEDYDKLAKVDIGSIDWEGLEDDLPDFLSEEDAVPYNEDLYDVNDNDADDDDYPSEYDDDTATTSSEDDTQSDDDSETDEDTTSSEEDTTSSEDDTQSEDDSYSESEDMSSESNSESDSEDNDKMSKSTEETWESGRFGNDDEFDNIQDEYEEFGHNEDDDEPSFVERIIAGAGMFNSDEDGEADWLDGIKKMADDVKDHVKTVSDKIVNQRGKHHHNRPGHDRKNPHIQHHRGSKQPGARKPWQKPQWTGKPGWHKQKMAGRHVDMGMAMGMGRRGRHHPRPHRRHHMRGWPGHHRPGQPQSRWPHRQQKHDKPWEKSIAEKVQWKCAKLDSENEDTVHKRGMSGLKSMWQKVKRRFWRGRNTEEEEEQDEVKMNETRACCRKEKEEDRIKCFIELKEKSYDQICAEKAKWFAGKCPFMPIAIKKCCHLKEKKRYDCFNETKIAFKKAKQAVKGRPNLEFDWEGVVDDFESTVKQKWHKEHDTKEMPWKMNDNPWKKFVPEKAEWMCDMIKKGESIWSKFSDLLSHLSPAAKEKIESGVEKYAGEMKKCCHLETKEERIKCLYEIKYKRYDEICTNKEKYLEGKCPYLPIAIEECCPLEGQPRYNCYNATAAEYKQKHISEWKMDNVWKHLKKGVDEIADKVEDTFHIKIKGHGITEETLEGVYGEPLETIEVGEPLYVDPNGEEMKASYREADEYHEVGEPYYVDPNGEEVKASYSKADEVSEVSDDDMEKLMSMDESIEYGDDDDDDDEVVRRKPHTMMKMAHKRKGRGRILKKTCCKFGKIKAKRSGGRKMACVNGAKLFAKKLRTRFAKRLCFAAYKDCCMKFGPHPRPTSTTPPPSTTVPQTTTTDDIETSEDYYNYY